MADFKKSVDALRFIKDLSMPQQAGKIIKASDAYAPFADQGIFTAPTMADRTKASVTGRLKGGMRFPHLQNVDPAYEGEVWGFGAGNMSTRLLNQFESVPSDKLLLSTILGNKYMHHSNPEVSAELIKQYRKGIKDKKLSNELRDVTNRRINQLTDDDGNPIFAPDSDVTDPAFYRSLDTFDKRAAMGNIMGGVGLNEGTERKRRVANQIFDYEGLMRKMTEPSIIGAPNSSIGSRIFTLSGTKSERPDLNKAYPHVVGGLDLNVDFGQVPFQHYLKDYTDNMMQTKGKVPGWFNLTRSSDLPTQEITDQWLQHLKNQGYKDGGAISPPAASMDGEQFMLAAAKAGMPTDIGSLNKIVDLVNKGLSIDEAIEALTNPMRKRDGGTVHMQDGGVFNPQSADYDYLTARAHGMGQDGGNWGSVAPTSDDERTLHGLPEDSYLMLKGEQHPTWHKAVEAEEARGSKIVKHGDRYYSVPRFDDGGQVEHMQAGGVKKAIGALGELTQVAPKKVTHGMLRRRGMEIGNKEEADALYSSGHRIFGMHELDEVPFEITDRKLFDSYAPDMMLAYPPDKPLLKADGGSVEHMQAGGLKTLMGEVLNRGGSYAARRLERAADEIPNLEKLFQEQALQRAFLGDNASAVMTMNPADFEKYAIPIHPYLTTKKFPTLVKDDYSTDDWVKHLKTVQGYDQVPHLAVDKGEVGADMLPIIIGHEGRHRNRALADKGVNSSLIQFQPRYDLREALPHGSQEQYIDAIRKEMQLTGNRVKPEQYYDPVADQEVRRRAIAMPDLYAEGGVAHKQVGGAMGLFERLMAQKAANAAAKAPKVLTPLERQYALEQFKAGSADPRQFYHGSRHYYLDDATSKPVIAPDEGIRNLQTPSQLKNWNYQNNADAVFLTPESSFSNAFAGDIKDAQARPAVYPVHAQVKNPFDIHNQEHANALIEEYKRLHIAPDDAEKLGRFKKDVAFAQRDPANWATIENTRVQDAIKSLGHDSFYVTENGVKNLGVYNPNVIKSSLGNRGTFDINEADMGKAEGGAVHSQIGGMQPEPAGGSARQETFAAQHMEEGGDIMRSLFDHALEKGDIHDLTHALLVQQHEAEHG